MQGIVDSFNIDGITNISKIEKPTILPASFIGGPYDMQIRYIDAIVLAQTYGKPDFFIIMTRNPA